MNVVVVPVLRCAVQNVKYFLLNLVDHGSGGRRGDNETGLGVKGEGGTDLEREGGEERERRRGKLILEKLR
jgi:hypothetical protein